MKAWLAFYPGDSWALWMLSLLVQVTLLLALASVASWMLRRHPAARHTLWLLALAGVIASPVLALIVRQTAPIIESAPTPARPAPLSNSGFVGPSVTSTQPTPTTTAANPPTNIVSQPIATSTTPGRSSGQTAATSPKVRPAVSWQRSIPSSDRLRSAFTIAVIVWLVGGMMFLARLLDGLRIVGRLRTSGQPCEDTRVLRLADFAAAGLRLRTRPQLLVTPAATSPLFLGLRRPVVLLPTELPATLDDAALTAVLRHEFSHAARGDAVVGVIAQLRGLFGGRIRSCGDSAVS